MSEKRWRSFTKVILRPTCLISCGTITVLQACERLAVWIRLKKWIRIPPVWRNIIASACNQTLRRIFLNSDTIAHCTNSVVYYKSGWYVTPRQRAVGYHRWESASFAPLQNTTGEVAFLVTFAAHFTRGWLWRIHPYSILVVLPKSKKADQQVQLRHPKRPVDQGQWDVDKPWLQPGR